jgi:micrococcal nuclease
MMKLKRLFIVAGLLVMTPSQVDTQQRTPLDSRYRDLVGHEVSARVTSVSDGDTFDVLVDGERRAIGIRLVGVDSPERHESHYDRARSATRAMALDKQVAIRPAGVERSGRLTAQVTVDGTDVGHELVRLGLACHDTGYSSDPVLARLELEAKRQGLGIWAPGVQKPRCVARKDGSLAGAAFRGNRISKLYHSASCRNYRCKNCVVVFATEADARSAGYRRASDCPDKPQRLK